MDILKKYCKTNFGKNVLMLTGGTAFGQILNIALSPIITRLYTPEEFGVLTLYVAILGMITIIGSLRYEMGIAIADSDEKSINVMSLSITILLLVVGITTLILNIFGTKILRFINGEALLNYMYLIPIGIFFTGLYSIFFQWASRKRNFKSITKTKLSQSVTQNFIKITFGVLSFGPVGLLLGNILGKSAGISSLSISLFSKENRSLLKKNNINDMAWSAKRYVKFPLLSTPSQFLNAAGIQLPVLLITALYGVQVAGYYGIANTIVNLPMLLIGKSISDVFYGEAVNIGKTDPTKLKQLSFKLFKKLTLLGLIPLTILVLFGPYLFSIVFGEDWKEAGIYAQILAVLVFSRLIFMPISRVYEVYEKQKEALFLDIFRVVLVLLVFTAPLLIPLNPYWTISFYTVAMSIVYLVTFLLSRKIINEEIINHRET